MEWNLFIVPLTGIIVQLFKTAGVPTKWLPLAAVALGAVLGALYGVNYRADVFTHVVEGIIYGASSAGIYDLVASSRKPKTE